MSLVTVQVGQCGNQIGGQFFSTIVDDLTPVSGPKDQIVSRDNYADISCDRFFSVEANGSLTARAVMVDMEPKVIAQTITDARKTNLWSYAAGADICERRGSGNNWAYGYFRHGLRAEKPTLEAVRRAVERCDRLGGFMTHMSLAGGTGSGLGAYLTQCLRDEYPHAFIANQVIWPYNSGEVIVQNYNAVLSLAHLYQSADALIAIENDALHSVCTRLLAIPKVSFQSINRVIAYQLASILAPACSSGSSTVIRNPVGDLMEQTIPYAAYKLMTVRSIPHVSDRSSDYTTYQWPGLLRHLRQMLIASSPMEEGIDWQVKPSSSNCAKSVSNLLILRGKDADTADIGAFREKSIYTSRSSSSLPPSFTLWTQRRPMLKREKFATLISNGQGSLIASLDRTVDRAWHMFASRAFVHQYVSNGLQEDDFIDCFASLEQVLADYQRL